MPTDAGANRWTLMVYAMAARLALIMILLVLAAVMASPAPDSGFYAFIGLTFLISIPYALWLREDRTVHASALYQFAVDTVIVTGLVHFTGGIDSQLSLLYPLVILAAGIVVNGRLALKVAILAVFLYATLVILEMSGAMVYRGDGPFPYGDPSRVLQMLMLRVFIFVLFAAASSYLADKCFFQARQLEHFRTIAAAILDSVAIPLLTVRGDGRIVTANRAAADILGESTEAIDGTDFTAHFPDSVPALDSAADARQIWTMQRRDGTRFPMAFQASKGDFEGTVLGTRAPESRDGSLYVVALRDVTGLINQTQGRQEVSQQVAAGMIAEMAHVVRNPLTAIRGAGEILNSAVDSMFTKADNMSEQDWQAVKSMSELIFQEIKQLDEKVEFFLECAADNPERLNELIADAETWRTKVIR